MEDFRDRFPDLCVVQNMHDLSSFFHSDGFGLIDHLTQFVEHQLVVIAEILLGIQYFEVGSFILLTSRAMVYFDLMLVSKLLFWSHLLLLVCSKGFVIWIAFADHAHIARIGLWKFLSHS